MEYYFIGVLAAILTTFGFVPQIIKIYRTKSIENISILTLWQFGFGVTLWMIYGIYRKDNILIISNFISLITLITLIILYYYYYYKNK